MNKITIISQTILLQLLLTESFALTVYGTVRLEDLTSMKSFSSNVVSAIAVLPDSLKERAIRYLVGKDETLNFPDNLVASGDATTDISQTALSPATLSADAQATIREWVGSIRALNTNPSTLFQQAYRMERLRNNLLSATSPLSQTQRSEFETHLDPAYKNLRQLTLYRTTEKLRHMTTLAPTDYYLLFAFFPNPEEIHTEFNPWWEGVPIDQRLKPSQTRRNKRPVDTSPDASAIRDTIEEHWPRYAKLDNDLPLDASPEAIRAALDRKKVRTILKLAENVGTQEIEAAIEKLRKSVATHLGPPDLTWDQIQQRLRVNLISDILQLAGNLKINQKVAESFLDRVVLPLVDLFIKNDGPQI